MSASHEFAQVVGQLTGAEEEPAICIIPLDISKSSSVSVTDRVSEYRHYIVRRLWTNKKIIMYNRVFHPKKLSTKLDFHQHRLTS